MEKEGTPMIRNKTLKTGASIILFSLLLFGCDSLFTTSIRKILEDPRDYAGKTVTVSGEVTRVLGLGFIKYFKIRDGTGEITVVTEKPLPKVGTKIKVKGSVKEAFSIGDQQVVVIVEKS
jgi:aspartyl/asparaginyl-tRNA synthetase